MVTKYDEGKRRYLDDAQKTEALYKRERGWSDEDLATLFGITLVEYQRSLNLPQWTPTPPMDLSRGKR
jgi:hypothetical protein